MESKVTIVIADDHPIFRKGLREVILEEKNFTIIGEAENGKEALEIISSKKPDIAIMDMEMPQMSGIEVLRKLKMSSSKLQTKVIFLTMYNEEEFLFKAMDFGASGYVLKDSALNEITTAIINVVEGNYYVSSSLTKYLINRGKSKSTDSSNETTLSKKIDGFNLLTPIEKHVLSLVAENKTSKEIADRLAISYRTVEKHRNNICKKLKLSGSYALLKFALEHRDEL